MRELAHLLSVLLVVPSLAVASVFVALGHATSQTGLLAFLFALLESIVLLLPWLFACVALLMTLAILGFSRRHRWAAAIAVAGVAIGSTGVIVWQDQGFGVDDAAFHVPAAIALVIAVWLSATEWPDRERPQSSTASPVHQAPRMRQLTPVAAGLDVVASDPLPPRQLTEKRPGEDTEKPS